MSNWNGTILGPPHVSLAPYSFVDHNSQSSKSAHENRIYSLKIHCGDQYPDVPPQVTFVSKINLPCVDQRTGKVLRQHCPPKTDVNYHQVEPGKLPCLSQWRRDFTMETILIELRRYVLALRYAYKSNTAKDRRRPDIWQQQLIESLPNHQKDPLIPDERLLVSKEGNRHRLPNHAPFVTS